MRSPRVLQITDLDRLAEDVLAERLAAAAALGAEACARFALELRDPQLDGRTLHSLAERLRERTARHGVALVVNDRLDLAIAVGADGVHLGRCSVSVATARRALGAGAWISRSAHDEAEVLAAARAGADAVLLSPIFASPGKGPPLGLGAIGQARAALDAVGTGEFPGGRPPALLALGGIDAEAGRRCLAAGADGVAAIRADLTELLGEKAPVQRV
jgi:thiamine-phosphate pyrophosphorylase